MIRRIRVKPYQNNKRNPEVMVFNLNCWRKDGASLEAKIGKKDKRFYCIAYGLIIPLLFNSRNHCSQEEIRHFIALFNFQFISSTYNSLPRVITLGSSIRNLMIN